MKCKSCKNKAIDGITSCDECRKKQRVRYQNNKKHIREQQKAYRKGVWGCFTVKCVTLRRNDKLRKRLPWKEEEFITPEYLSALWKSNNTCHYCGVLMTLKGDLRKLQNGCTVERLDNKLAHTKSNCVLACTKCNRKRGVKTPEQMITKRVLTRSPIVCHQIVGGVYSRFHPRA